MTKITATFVTTGAINFRLFPKFNGNKDALGVCLVPVKKFLFSTIDLQFTLGPDIIKEIKYKVKSG